MRRLAEVGGMLLALISLCIGGCGFQPRGVTEGLNTKTLPSPLLISGIGRFSPLYRALERQLAIADVKIAPPAADAAFGHVGNLPSGASNFYDYAFSDDGGTSWSPGACAWRSATWPATWSRAGRSAR